MTCRQPYQASFLTQPLQKYYEVISIGLAKVLQSHTNKPQQGITKLYQWSFDLDLMNASSGNYGEISHETQRLRLWIFRIQRGCGRDGVGLSRDRTPTARSVGRQAQAARDRDAAAP